ncbi:MAG: GNAT family N-acetyltransferase [Rhodobacteraceae bacterium]|nr:GNAT family N-acetyltransferase [Paracoccaceae bacterium]
MKVRPATPADAADMARILNAVIAIGGTTAHETPKSVAEVCEAYVTGADVLSSTVCEDAGTVVGWQSVGLWQDAPHIGSFVQPGVQAKGIGGLMFDLTCATLQQRGVDHIIAHIRADNVPGLAYYSRIGFRDIGRDPDFALRNGDRVGQVQKRFDLAPLAQTTG